MKTTQENMSLATSDNILNEIKNFLKTPGGCLLGEAIISGNMALKVNLNESISGFILANILKDRISTLESERK